MTRSVRGKRQVSKKVLALQEALCRKRGVRNLNERFLIVCEDGKSAPHYFEALKRHRGLSATAIAVSGSDDHTQPIQVVQLAIARKKAAKRRDSGTEPFDQVWCVIDGDYGAAINNARSSANANGVKLAVTTVCFEYWIVLHFEDSASPANDCDSVVKALKRKHVPGYSKGHCDFSDIVPHADTASGRARQLRRCDELPENQNPCSDVFLLIDAIKQAML